ncbi:Protein kinase domain [Trypanosoma melophagium]|uniref:Protein kinase domain n=1 Tax=Trypanosoma melophagium TaxID=715481 RepID=UPI00351AA1E4|nr:Protein kinase domain [Trypanosoma melophagium]
MEHIRKTKKKLGIGARGIVYEGYDEERGRFVAVKEIPFFDGGNSCCGSSPCSSHSSSNSSSYNKHGNNINNHHDNGFDHAAVIEEDPVLVEERRAIVREISLMERFEHPNLVAYYGARRSAVGVQIIMEYVNGGSLDALIRRHGSLRESVVRSYTRDILEGLAYLHDTARVCHRDVKPANVLITADGRCKLTDFGVSKLLDDNGTMRTTVGTPWYMAPEVINGTVETEEEIETEEEEEEKIDMHACDPHSHRHTPTKQKRIKRSYTTAADIWSLGVTVFEMISGRKPFGQEMKSPAAVLFVIAAADRAPPRLPDNCDASLSLRCFLDLCFVRDARLRPSARELLSHQWFTESHSPSTMASPKKTSIVASNNNNTTRRGSSSANSSSRIIDAGAPRQKQQQQIQPPLLSSLSMLDTVDLINGVMEPRRGPITPLSQRCVQPTQLSSEMISAIVPGKMSFSSASDTQGGFWSSDGHYVDLIVTSPLTAPPVQKRESK